MHMAAVAETCDPEPVRAFGTFTGDLHRLADWFKSCGVRTVAMESTGVYWIPAYEVLEQRGFEVVLVNARDERRAMAAPPARIWAPTRQLPPTRRGRHASCLIAPAGAAAGLCRFAYPAHAKGADADEPANASFCVGCHRVTRMKIIRAIVAGERNPATLAALRDTRCHASIETIQ
jgi:transposase